MHNVVDFLGRYGGFILLLMVVSPSLGLPLMGVIGYPIDLITSFWIQGLGMVLG